MAGQTQVVGTLTITNGGTDSNAIVDSEHHNGYFSSCILYCPGTLPETCTIMVDFLQTGQTWYTLFGSSGAAIALAAGAAIPFYSNGYMSIKIHSAGAVGGNRVFTLVAQLDMAT